MNNEEKTKIGIDINNLDLTPMIDDKSINDGSSNEKKEVKLFPDITDNVSVKDNSSLPNETDKLVEEGGVNLFPNIETDFNSSVVKQEEDVNKPEKETEFNSKKMSNNINGASFIKYSILLFINLVFFWKVMIIFFSSYSSHLLYFIVNIICLIIYSIYFFINIDKVSLRFLNYPLLLSLYCVFIFDGLDNIDNSLLNTINYLIIDNELFLIGGACIIGLVLDFTKYHDDVENGIIPFIKSKKDTNHLVAEESNKKSNLTSIFLFIFALLQFIVIPFIFRTTNSSEGLSIEYPYPIVKDLLYVGFIIFSFLVYFNYKNEGKNLRNFNIIFYCVC